MQNVLLTRDMNGESVKKKIGRVFNTEEWRYLDVKQDNSLSMSDEQLSDGHNLCSRRGYVYILVSSSKG